MFLKYSNCLLLPIICFLFGCSNKLNVDKTLLTKSALQLQQKYKLPHADLVIQYGLAENTHTGIFTKNLGVIMNDPKQNRIFLSRFHNKKLSTLDQVAKKKVIYIQKLISKLNAKYHILSKDEVGCFTKNYITCKKNYIRELAVIDKVIATVPLMMPEYQAKVTSHYGYRKLFGKRCFHKGIDLQASKDSQIYASANGVVTKVAKAKGYGNFIEIKHSRNLVTKYAHLKNTYVKEGDKVIRGEKIGVQGKSGNATGEHLHLEILLNQKPINPYDFISHY